ncbi:MAG: ferritin-like domain-containing protein [Nitrosarchaeum sp.]
MGKKGREIVQAKINVDEVITDLSKAYADEWCAHYQYWLAAHWVNGINADAVSSRLTTQSADELMHAERFANRIIELGGHPVMELEKITKVGGCGYKAPPKEQGNLKQVIQDVIDAERCAIDFYNKMAEKYKDKDYVTFELFKTVLLDEVSDEDEWEDLLAQQP